MARPWAATSWNSYMPKLYAGQRPGDFESTERSRGESPSTGVRKAFSRTTDTSHDESAASLTRGSGPVLVLMGEMDVDFPDSKAEADWIANASSAQVVNALDAGHYTAVTAPPRSPPRQCFVSWKGSKTVPRTEAKGSGPTTVIATDTDVVAVDGPTATSSRKARGPRRTVLPSCPPSPSPSANACHSIVLCERDCPSTPSSPECFCSAAADSRSLPMVRRCGEFSCRTHRIAQRLTSS